MLWVLQYIHSKPEVWITCPKMAARFRVFRRFEREMWVAKNGSLVYWSKKEAFFFEGNFWVVATQICFFHPYLGKIPILTNIFQMGWNHQLDFAWKMLEMLMKERRTNYDKNAKCLHVGQHWDGIFSWVCNAEMWLSIVSYFFIYCGACQEKLFQPSWKPLWISVFWEDPNYISVYIYIPRYHGSLNSHFF